MKTKSIVACVLAVASLAWAQKPKSRAEGEAVNAIISAQTPDQKIEAVDKLLSKYKDTEFKAMALEQAAESYEQKRDSVNAIIWGQRAIDADPKNFSALLLVARQIAQTTGENDLDKDDKIKRGNTLADQAIAALNSAAKPNPNLPDQQWEDIKKDLIAQAHETKGVLANVDKKWDVAISELKMAAEGSATKEPGTVIRLASVYNNAGKFAEASATADQALAMPMPDNVKTIAQNEKARAEKGKAGKK